MFSYIFLNKSPIIAQSDFDKVIKGGEIVLNGLSFFKSNKTEKVNHSKTIEYSCLINKLTDKIIFNLLAKD